MTSKEYMHCVTAVDPTWLAESAPMFYSLRITEYTSSGNILSAKKINLAKEATESPSNQKGPAKNNDISENELVEDEDSIDFTPKRSVAKTPRRSGI